MELYDSSLSHENFFLTKMGPARKRNPKLSKLRITFHNYKLPGGDVWAPEYLVGMKGSGRSIGFDCRNVRRADGDNAARIVQFLYEAVTGKLPDFSWYYLRSFAELVRVEKGEAPRPTPEQERLYESDKKKLPNDHLRIEYDRGLAFAEDITRISKKHDELFRDKILAEKDHLEMLGPDGKSLDVAKSLSKKLEQP